MYYLRRQLNKLEKTLDSICKRTKRSLQSPGLIDIIKEGNSGYPLVEFQKNPISWLKWTGFTSFWYKQQEVIESIRDNQRTIVRSGHSVGKTKIAAEAALWFYYNFPPAVVVTTAPTGRQNQFLLWGEIRKAYRRIRQQVKARLGLDLGDELYDSLYLEAEKGLWYAVGFSTNESESFTGFHEVNILFVVDEGAGVEEKIFGAIEGSLNSDNSKVLVIGNPTDPGSYFGKLFLTKEGKDWNKIHINCWDSPNVKAGRNIIPGLCSWDWPKRMLEKWGESNPWYLIKVVGEFPEYSTHSLVSYHKAYQALVEDLELILDRKLILAVDVAREGDDYSVFLLREKVTADYVLAGDESDDWRPKPAGIIEWEGVEILPEERDEDEEKMEDEKPEPVETAAVVVQKIGKCKTTEITSQVIRLLREYPAIEDVVIDMVGIGAGVYDTLLEMKENGEAEELDKVELYGVNVGENSSNTERYLNLRAELADIVREEIETVLLYNDSEIVDQVSQIRFRPERKGRMALLSKEEFKKSYRRSPDELDALMLSYVPRVMKTRFPQPKVRFL
jgi:hypothetical protein